MSTVIVVGSGLVGQATGKGLIAKGHHVLFMDTNPTVVDRLRDAGFAAFLEGDEAIAWDDADVIMICVNVSLNDGKPLLENVHRSTEMIAEALAGRPRYQVVAVRTTVPPTTTTRVIKPLLELHSGREVGRDVGLCVNPQFLRRLSAEEDFLNPWWHTVLGYYLPDDRVDGVMSELYRPFAAPIERTDCTTAETVPYAVALYNAAKISHFNEMHLVYDRLGVNGATVTNAVVHLAEGMWNPEYGIKGGWPFGGVSMVRDTAVFSDFTRRLGMEMPMLAGTLRMNEIIDLQSSHPAPASAPELANAATTTDSVANGPAASP